MKISDDFKQQLCALQGQLLDLIDEATSVERVLFETYGETEQTLADLEVLMGIQEQAADTYQRTTTLGVRTAQDPPALAITTMKLLQQAQQVGQQRLVPLLRSVQEIRNDWELP